MSELPFGIDISSYQFGVNGEKPDFDKINSTCDFVAVRSGISWGYVDKWFRYSWDNIAIPRLAYHVLYPGEPAAKQMDHFLNIVRPKEHDRLVLDVELDHGYSKARITQTLLDCLDFILANTGRYPVIYSRASWVNQFLNVMELPDNLDWWLAHYLKALPTPQYTPEKEPPPALPKGVSNWLIHQTGDHGNGSVVGVVSHYVDTDRWNGTKKELLAYFGLGEEVPPEPEPPNITQFQARVYDWATPYVNIRKEPDIKSQDLGDLYPGTVVPVYEIVGDWYRTDKGFVMSKYLERLDLPLLVIEKYYGPLYWQRDPRWKDKSLGTSGTIGSYGCVMTAETNALNQLGIVTNPVVNNAWRTANGGYHNGNLIVWEKVSEQHPDIIWEGKTWNPTDAQIKQKIADGCPLVMLVDHNEGTPVLDEHWVNSIPSPADDDAIWIHDPWDNLTIRLRDRYKKPIQQFSSYRRQA